MLSWAPPFAGLPRAARRGFTLVELLVVMSIIAILAATLIPAIAYARRMAKVASTKTLLSQTCSALGRYSEDWGSYPPDWVPSGTDLIKLKGYDPTKTQALNSFTPAPAISATSQALYYYLANPNITRRHPYLELQVGLQATSFGGLGGYDLYEVCDAWQRPFLYNRPAFLPDSDFNCKGSGVLEDPAHNTTTYDLYSVGADGQTGSDLLPSPENASTLAQFNSRAMNEFSDGNSEDDISNWK